LKATTVSLYVVSVGLVASLTGVAVLAFNLSTVRANLTAGEERTEEAERETQEALDDLEATKEQLRNVRESLRNARVVSPAPTENLAEQLANGTAVPTDGLSVSLPPKFWTCTDWKGDECHGLKDEAVFKNDTQIGQQ